MSMETKETKHLIFKETGQKPKTKVWTVYNKHTQEVLGQVLWYPPFRGYCFDDGAVVYAESCLKDLAQFVHDQMASRRTAKVNL